jgi:hypothetical protein
LELNSEFGSFPSVRMLAQEKKLALRHRVWFKLLSRVERGIIDLTVRCVEYIKSPKLAKVVMAIMDKLKIAKESIVDRLVRFVGLPLALRISKIAIDWGNHLASGWADDHAFARFLVINFGKT